MSSLPNELRHWRNRGGYVDVFGRDVFVVEAGSQDAEPLLILHGYPYCQRCSANGYRYRSSLSVIGFDPD